MNSRKFKDVPPERQKQLIKVLQMCEAEGLLYPPVSHKFLALLEPEISKEQ